MTTDIDDLEHEARLMRARNERLERELAATRAQATYWRDMHEKVLAMLVKQAAGGAT